ncbi:MAG: ZIP family metal transporter [Clostridia bacterium]|nr:ZIP family metal transporter [Clostridia bacterium]
MQWFFALSGWQQALIATGFTWALTAAGAALVFICKKVTRNAFCFMMSSAAGIMLASTFFSLLMPALEYEQQYSFLILTSGFALGGLMIIFTDILIGKLGRFSDDKKKKCAVMTIAVTAHNVPEGLAVGVALGAVAAGGGTEGIAALMLAVGIGIQNFPEGICVAFPLRANGMGRFKSFMAGQLSGAVEILAGVVGALAVSFINNILPFALSFSAGAMLAVVCSELIPESFENGKVKATIGVIFGFVVMMILDIAFG